MLRNLCYSKEKYVPAVFFFQFSNQKSNHVHVIIIGAVRRLRVFQAEIMSESENMFMNENNGISGKCEHHQVFARASMYSGLMVPRRDTIPCVDDFRFKVIR